MNYVFSNVALRRMIWARWTSNTDSTRETISVDDLGTPGIEFLAPVTKALMLLFCNTSSYKTNISTCPGVLEDSKSSGDLDDENPALIACRYDFMMSTYDPQAMLTMFKSSLFLNSLLRVKKLVNSDCRFGFCMKNCIYSQLEMARALDFEPQIRNVQILVPNNAISYHTSPP